MKVKILLLTFLGTFLLTATASSAQVQIALNPGLAVNYGPPSFRTLTSKYWSYAPQFAIQAKTNKFRLELGIGDMKSEKSSFFAGDPECGMGNTTPYRHYATRFKTYLELGFNLLNSQKHSLEWVNGVNFTQVKSKRDVVYEEPGFVVSETKEQVLAWHTGFRYSYKVLRRIQPFIQVDYSPFSSGYTGYSDWSRTYSERWDTQQLQRNLHSVIGISIQLN